MVTFQFPHGGVGRRPRFPVRPSSLSFYRDTDSGKATSGSQGRVKCVIKRVCAVHTITEDTEDPLYIPILLHPSHIDQGGHAGILQNVKCQFYSSILSSSLFHYHPCDMSTT